MKKHVENARLLAKFLNECDDVEWVSYAELPDSPNYELAKNISPMVLVDYILLSQRWCCWW
ncbi:MAG: PLP-dependent transferase [Thomasclavelia ramosa]